MSERPLSGPVRPVERPPWWSLAPRACNARTMGALVPGGAQPVRVARRTGAEGPGGNVAPALIGEAPDRME